MDISQKGIKFIEGKESCELKAYQDQGGVWTIGYGSTHGVYAGLTITQQQADHLFQVDIEARVKLVNEYVKAPCNQNQFDCLCSFTYNAGLGSLLSLVKSSGIDSPIGNILNVPAHLIQYNKYFDTKTKTFLVSQGLVNRRTAELELFKGQINV